MLDPRLKRAIERSIEALTAQLEATESARDALTDLGAALDESGDAVDGEAADRAIEPLVDPVMFRVTQRGPLSKRAHIVARTAREAVEKSIEARQIPTTTGAFRERLDVLGAGVGETFDVTIERGRASKIEAVG